MCMIQISIPFLHVESPSRWQYIKHRIKFQEVLEIRAFCVVVHGTIYPPDQAGFQSRRGNFLILKRLLWISLC